MHFFDIWCWRSHYVEEISYFWCNRALTMKSNENSAVKYKTQNIKMYDGFIFHPLFKLCKFLKSLVSIDTYIKNLIWWGTILKDIHDLFLERIVWNTQDNSIMLTGSYVSLRHRIVVSGKVHKFSAYYLKATAIFCRLIYIAR